MNDPDGPALADFSPGYESTLREILVGLSAREKRVPTKLLYDARGSALFEKICGLDEYYLTRTELGIMQAHADAMAAAAGPECLLIEYGSGSSIKTRLLLDRLREPVAYVPIDISRAALQQSVEMLCELYPRLRVLPVCADYMQPYEIPETSGRPRRRLIYFPGSTIGNLEPNECLSFLKHMAAACGPGGGALIGVDLHKDTARLEAAYDDSQGVTAEFELNALEHINREYGGNFDLSRFAYEAFYDERERRVEMYVVSLADQQVRVGNAAITLTCGERITIEYSHKFTPEGFARLARASGLRVERVWCDPEELFSVQYLTVDPD